MNQKICARLLTTVCGILQIGCCIAIICIVAIQLDDVQIDLEWNPAEWNITSISCALGPNWNGGSLCNYAYAVCAISLACWLLLGILLLVTCNFCGIGPFIEFIVVAVALAWWIIASIIVTDQVSEAPDYESAGSTIRAYRKAVIGLAWASVGLFGILCILHLWGMILFCKGDRGSKKSEAYKEPAGNAPPPQNPSGPAPNQQFITQTQ